MICLLMSDKLAIPVSICTYGLIALNLSAEILESRYNGGPAFFKTKNFLGGGETGLPSWIFNSVRKSVSRSSLSHYTLWALIWLFCLAITNFHLPTRVVLEASCFWDVWILWLASLTPAVISWFRLTSCLWGSKVETFELWPVHIGGDVDAETKNRLRNVVLTHATVGIILFHSLNESRSFPPPPNIYWILHIRHH